MASFKDRPARLDFSFPLVFRVADETIEGNCLNLSASGLLGTFQQPLDLWTTGDLLLRFGRNTYELPARVARVEDREAGLSFAFRNDADREAILQILDFAERGTHLLGAPPF